MLQNAIVLQYILAKASMNAKTGCRDYMKPVVIGDDPSMLTGVLVGGHVLDSVRKGMNRRSRIMRSIRDHLYHKGTINA